MFDKGQFQYIKISQQVMRHHCNTMYSNQITKQILGFEEIIPVADVELRSVQNKLIDIFFKTREIMQRVILDTKKTVKDKR